MICAFAAFFRASRLACFGLLRLILRVFPLDLAFLRYLAGFLLFSSVLLSKNLCKFCLYRAYISMPSTVHIFLSYLPWSPKIRGLDRFDCSKSRFLNRKRPTKGLV